MSFIKKISALLSRFSSTLCCVVLLLTSACSGLGGAWTYTVSINVDFDANNDSATAVDVVFVYSDELLGTLKTLPAAQYFAKAEQLKYDNPKLIDIIRFEVAPGQMIINAPLSPSRWRPKGGFVFASYQVPGEFRVGIGNEYNLKIHLHKATFTVNDKTM